MTDRIWFDIPTPKYARLFPPLIRWLERRGIPCIVTTRSCDGYSEASRMLEHSGIPAHVLGAHGGATMDGKLLARLERQREFVRLFDRLGRPGALICGCAPDSVQAAFGLGIPIAVFSDMPIRAHAFAFEDVTAVSKLTLPFADLVLHPFVVPAEVFRAIGVDPRKLRAYDFLDPVLWLQDMQRDAAIDFRERFGIPKDRPTILVREEEYGAHYVTVRLSTVHDSIDALRTGLNASIVLMPRYGIEPLRGKMAGRAFVLDETIPSASFFPFIDMLVGGGGTMNLEAAYLGIPVISTRSIQVHYDRFLIENGLMHWAGSAAEVLETARHLLARSRPSVATAADGPIGAVDDPRAPRSGLFSRCDEPLEQVGGYVLEFLERHRMRA